MKYALIGCGRISPNHIEAAKNNKLEFEPPSESQQTEELPAEE